MKRKRLTVLFPQLLPLRVKQRKLCFYAGMRFDGRHYSSTISTSFMPYKFYSAKFALYNHETGFDILYQENKVFNLKLAAKALNGLLIKPGETFSFWRSVRYADKHTPYRDGLIVVNGKLTTSQGGGLCLMSNLLFWIFLHSPFSIAERHTHMVKDFPTPQNTGPDGVDATVREGWLDLKIKNETDTAFQIRIDFDNDNIIGSILTDKSIPYRYEVEGRNHQYYRKSGDIFERVSILQSQICNTTQQKLTEIFLYENICRIGYQLPMDALINESGA